MRQFMTGANVITVIVLAGFCGISFLAMKPETAGVSKEVVLYLLGAWQSMAAAAVAYHIGSSAGSREKDMTIKSMSTDAATTATATSATAATAATAASAAVDAVRAATAATDPNAVRP
jgi:hypothetical protein